MDVFPFSEYNFLRHDPDGGGGSAIVSWQALLCLREGRMYAYASYLMQALFPHTIV